VVQRLDIVDCQSQNIRGAREHDDYTGNYSYYLWFASTCTSCSLFNWWIFVNIWFDFVVCAYRWFNEKVVLKMAKGKASLPGQFIPASKVPKSAGATGNPKTPHPIPNTRGDKKIKGL
jgi:hypothetical protein